MAYSFSQLEQYWIAAGGPPAVAPTMASIAMAESGGNPNAYNPTDNNGTQSSWGLWQISNGTHASVSPTWNDPLTNAQLAVQKFKTQGLSAWGTYTSGAYLNYLPQGGAASAAQTATDVAATVSAQSIAAPGPGGTRPVQLGTVGTVLQHIDQLLNPQTHVKVGALGITSSINTSVVSQFATRGFAALIGLGAIYVGFKVFSRSSTNDGSKSFISQVNRSINTGTRVGELRTANRRLAFDQQRYNNPRPISSKPPKTKTTPKKAATTAVELAAL